MPAISTRRTSPVCPAGSPRLRTARPASETEVTRHVVTERAPRTSPATASSSPAPSRTRLARPRLEVAGLCKEVERRRLPAEAIRGDRRQQVLCGVLLHVVEAPRPVEAHRRATGARCRREGGEDLAAAPLYLLHRDRADPAAVRPLPAAVGIVHGIGEPRPRPARLLANCEHVDLQLVQPRVALVGRQSRVSHAGPLTRT